MRNFRYLASVAELYYQLKASDVGLDLHVHGFSDKVGQ
jgi:secreted Zn-dependent insulinase-like peptidase